MGKKLVIPLIVIALLLGYWGYRRNTYLKYVSRQQNVQNQRLDLKPRDFNATDDPDAEIALKALSPASLQDEKNLKGQTLWVSAGGQMTYYPYNGKAIDFNHPAGLLLGAEKIAIKDALEQPVPKLAASRFPDGDSQVMLVFQRPDDPNNPTREYAVPVGDREGHDYNILTDQLFFYNDPHQLYSHWGPEVWKAIDAHTAILGMTERQVGLALGSLNTPRGDSKGDRSVEFDDQGKPKLITFVDGKATEIRDESR